MNRTYNKFKKITRKLYKLALIGSLLMIPLEGISLFLMVFSVNVGITTIFEVIDYFIDNKITTVEEYKQINYDNCRKKIIRKNEPIIEKERKLIIIDEIQRLEQKIQTINNKSELQQLKIELTKLQFLLNDLLSEDQEIINKQTKLNQNIIEEIDRKIQSQQIDNNYIKVKKRN